MKTAGKMFLASAIAAVTLTAQAAPITTDIIAVVDESGSMAGEHAWLSNMIFDLDSNLAAAAGADPFSARYGLTGFGGGLGHTDGHVHNVGAGAFGDAGEFSTATATLETSGGTEDGYAGINTALSYDLRANAVANIILVTDEDRDNYNPALNYDNILAQLNGIDSLLNAVLNVSILCGDNSQALGMDAEGTGYKADGAGGYSSCAGAYAASGAGSSITDYANMALATGGAVWDLNQLRSGGLTAESFTNAFVAIKVKETVDNGGPTPSPVSEPATLALLALGLGLGAGARRRPA